jgi:hypothetical protein
MQTITLEFKKLDRLPVPTSFDEVLFEQTIIGTIYSYVPTYDPIDQWSFEVKGLDSNSTYAHVKVTATETDFKVGDRVLYKGKEGYKVHQIDYGLGVCSLIQPILRGMLTANITDLTLIPNE